MMIHTKSDWEIALLREAGRINAGAHRQAETWMVPGTTTQQLDDALARFITDQGGRSSFQGVFGFPGATCISVNDGVGHGVPGPQELQEGDVVKVDIGVEFEGYHSDAATTYIVGTGSPSAKRLLKVTEEALWAGIRAAEVGRRMSDISHALYQVVTTHGYQVVRHAFGHGIGEHLHEDPQIAPFGPAGYGPRVRPGMILAIEPIVVAGGRYTTTLADGWTTRTIDGSLAAHFEHTIRTTEEGPEVLTAWPDENSFGQTFAQAGGITLSLNGGPLPIDGPMSFAIRAQSTADETAILRLAQAQMNDVLKEAWGRPVQPAEVLHPKGATTLVVIDPQGALAGFFTYSMQTVVHLNTLVVDSMYQGTGLGKALMSEIERIARKRHYPAVELWVQTNNLRALKFYEKLGYETFSKPFFNTLAMRKEL